MFGLNAMWAAKDDPVLREKIVEMATEFCVEASVLVSVLGILDSAIALHGVPGVRVFVLSVTGGAVFFGTGCIIQLIRASRPASITVDEAGEEEQ